MTTPHENLKNQPGGHPPKVLLGITLKHLSTPQFFTLGHIYYIH
jgi:hypothetical protein